MHIVPGVEVSFLGPSYSFYWVAVHLLAHESQLRYVRNHISIDISVSVASK